MENIAVEVFEISKKFNFEKSNSDSKKISKLSSLKNSKSFLAVDNISFNIKKGEVLGIIGPNGSGKTTLLRIISGIYKPDQGYVHIFGRISSLLQLGAGFQGDFSSKENIIVNGMLMGFSKSEMEKKVEKIIQYAELGKFSNLKLKFFSAGMRARLAFASAMELNPDILLVDEILSVGDKKFKEKSYESFFNLKKNNKTILFATHNISKIAELADSILLIDKGKKIMIGTPSEVIQKYNEIY